MTDLDELLVIARKMGNHRVRDRDTREDAIQEASVKAWQLLEQGKSRNYIVKSMANSFNRELGAMQKRPAPLPVLSVQEPVQSDFHTSDLDWINGVARDDVDREILKGVMAGMKLPEVARTWGRKRWDSYLRPALEQRWKELS